MTDEWYQYLLGACILTVGFCVVAYLVLKENV